MRLRKTVSRRTEPDQIDSRLCSTAITWKRAGQTSSGFHIQRSRERPISEPPRGNRETLSGGNNELLDSHAGRSTGLVRIGRSQRQHRFGQEPSARPAGRSRASPVVTSSIDERPVSVNPRLAAARLPCVRGLDRRRLDRGRRGCALGRYACDLLDASANGRAGRRHHSGDPRCSAAAPIAHHGWFCAARRPNRSGWSDGLDHLAARPDPGVHPRPRAARRCGGGRRCQALCSPPHRGSAIT